MTKPTGAHDRFDASEEPTTTENTAEKKAEKPAMPMNTTENKPSMNNVTSLDPTLQAAGTAKGPKKGSNKSKRHVPGWAIVLAIIAALALIIGGVLMAKKNSGTAANKTPETNVTIGAKLAPTNLDIRNTAGTALDQVLIGNVYESLVGRDSDNNVKPGLAKSWQISDDGKTYTFELHDGMKFSNGDVLNADDVVWSLNESRKEGTHNADVLSAIENVTAPDDNTVVLTLKHPDSDLLWNLSGRAGLVFDVDAEGKYNPKTQAVGSGPFTVQRFIADDSVTLKRNDNYWGKNKAKTEQITIKYFADDNAAVNALKSGDVAVLAPVMPTVKKTFEEDPTHYTTIAGDDTDKYVLAMNNAAGKVTADKRVRQAIRYAIDHNELIAAWGNTDKPLYGPIPSLDPGYEDLSSLYPHDEAKAKQLLKEAGYDAQHPLKITLTYPNTYGPELGDMLRSQLSRVGIDLDVHMVEFSAWLEQVYTNKNYDLSLVDHNESHDIGNWANPDYYFNYNNAEVQKLITDARTNPDEKKSNELLKQAARIISEDAAADWLFNFRATTAMAKGVENFPVNMNQTFMPLADFTYTKQ
ncbi:ABC transporter substrate-binding protein [Bifidobacterium dolichotidis]|uniref:ABC transporter substrate-binding protein n=1 Tax=Bifidobacterium dolichotidis TaxID=2306976 RepID=A0A430FPR9_9BIFI|nr:ABC transporter substrate-binding protein [Bifidobacterium dolichotidis]RSX54837.1 ABC transporter substrate-binding protein [Bifidobacterium dolichotidis]